MNFDNFDSFKIPKLQGRDESGLAWEARIKEAIKKRHEGAQWVLFFELRIGTGYDLKCWMPTTREA